MKKKLKRSLAILMSVCMIMSMMPGMAWATETGNTDDSVNEELQSGNGDDQNLDDEDKKTVSDPTPEENDTTPADTTGEESVPTAANDNDEVDTPATALPAAVEGVIKLASNVTVGTLTLPATGETLTYDLNGFTLTYTGGSVTITGVNTKLAFTDSFVSGDTRGGTLELTGLKANNSVLCPEDGASVSAENINITCTGSVFYPKGNATAVDVIKCDVKADCYCVGTNAARVDNYGVNITLKDSNLTADGNGNDNTPVLINVAGTLNIDNCNILGTRQGVIVRAGTATIKDSNITTKGMYGNKTHHYAGANDTWGSGNEVPAAALTVGNYKAGDATSYCADALVTLENTDLTAENDFPALYVDGNTAYTATVNITGGSVSGNIIKGFQKADGKVNLNISDSTLTDARVAKIVNGGNTTYFDTLQEAVDAAENYATVTLLKDITTDTQIADITKKITLDLNSKKITTSVSAVLKVSGSGDLTITGNGTIEGPTGDAGKALDGKAVIEVHGNATLTMPNGFLTAGGVGSDGMYGIYALDGGNVILGDSETKEGPTIETWFAAIGENNTTSPANITIYGGTYTELATPNNNEWWSYFCAPVYASASGEINILGGTFNGYYGISSRYVNVDQKLNIKGGTFNGSNAALFIDTKNGITCDKTREVSVTGGTFSTNVSAYTAEGYICATAQKSGYVVSKKPVPTVAANANLPTYASAFVESIANNTNITSKAAEVAESVTNLLGDGAYLKMEVTAGEDDSGKVASITYNVEPMAVSGDVADDGSVQYKAQSELNKPITFYLSVPEDWAAVGMAKQKHTHNGKDEFSYYSILGETDNRYVAVTSDKFSSFELSSMTADEKAEKLRTCAVMTENTVYEEVSIQDAINYAVTNSETLTVLNDVIGTYDIPGTLIVDANGHTWTVGYGSGSAANAVMLAANTANLNVRAVITKVNDDDVTDNTVSVKAGDTVTVAVKVYKGDHEIESYYGADATLSFDTSVLSLSNENSSIDGWTVTEGTQNVYSYKGIEKVDSANPTLVTDSLLGTFVFNVLSQSAQKVASSIEITYATVVESADVYKSNAQTPEMGESTDFTTEKTVVTPPTIAVPYKAAAYTVEELNDALATAGDDSNGVAYAEYLEVTAANTEATDVATDYAITFGIKADAQGTYCFKEDGEDTLFECKSAKYSITKVGNAWVEGKEPTITGLDGDSKIKYTGSAVEAVAGTLKFGNSNDIKVKYYAANAGSSASITYSDNELASAPTDKGNYKVVFTLTGDGKNYEDFKDAIAFEITQGSLAEYVDKWFTLPAEIEGGIIYSYDPEQELITPGVILEDDHNLEIQYRIVKANSNSGSVLSGSNASYSEYKNTNYKSGNLYLNGNDDFDSSLTYGVQYIVHDTTGNYEDYSVYSGNLRYIPVNMKKPTLYKYVTPAVSANAVDSAATTENNPYMKDFRVMYVFTDGDIGITYGDGESVNAAVYEITDLGYKLYPTEVTDNTGATVCALTGESDSTDYEHAYAVILTDTTDSGNRYALTPVALNNDNFKPTTVTLNEDVQVPNEAKIFDVDINSWINSSDTLLVKLLMNYKVLGKNSEAVSDIAGLIESGVMNIGYLFRSDVNKDGVISVGDINAICNKDNTYYGVNYRPVSAASDAQ
jgi:hypothetical protein